MFWYVLSKLKLSYPMNGYGRLLREWPANERIKNWPFKTFKHLG